MSLNKAMIIGRLGRDPELRYTGGGQAVGDFSVATDSSYTDKAGQKQKETEWHRVVVWGKLAENCKEYLAKGRQVYVEGRLKTRDWEDRDGNERRTTEIVANNVVFLGSKGEGGGGSGGRREDPPPPDDDDIPF